MMRFGNVSAWVLWTLSTGTLDEYSLMNSKGDKSTRYKVGETVTILAQSLFTLVETK
jgi:hypothetical protein